MLDSFQSWTYDTLDSLFSPPGRDAARCGFQTIAGYDLFTQQPADRTLAYENFLKSAAGTSQMFAAGSAAAYGRAAALTGLSYEAAPAAQRLGNGGLHAWWRDVAGE
jgi:hypothetical protein